MEMSPAINCGMGYTIEDARMEVEEREQDLAEAFALAVLYILKRRGHGSQAKIARDSGVGSSYLNDILKQRKRGTEEKRRAITDALGLPYQKVIDFGEKLRSNRELINQHSDILDFETIPTPPREDDEEFIDIPRVKARLSAGNGSLISESEIVSSYKFRRDWVSRVSTSPSKLVLMSAVGDSMEPVIPDKALVLVDQGKTELSVGKTFAVGLEDEILIKRIDKQPGKVILKSWNQAYDPIIIDMTNEAQASSFRVIGRVIWMGTAM